MESAGELTQRVEDGASALRLHQSRSTFNEGDRVVAGVGLLVDHWVLAAIHARKSSRESRVVPVKPPTSG